MTDKCWYCGKPLPCNCACQTNDERKDRERDFWKSKFETLQESYMKVEHELEIYHEHDSRCQWKSKALSLVAEFSKAKELGCDPWECEAIKEAIETIEAEKEIK